MTSLPALPVAIPLLCAALIAGLRKFLPRWLIDTIGLSAAAANLCISLLLFRSAWIETIVYWFGNWYPRNGVALGIAFVVDPAGAAMAALAALLMLLALLFSWGRLESAENHYQPLMLVFLAAMSGFVLTGDLFNMFVFFELMSTVAFALCGLKVQEPSPLQGAFNFAVTNTIAAFLVLTGIAFLYAATGALNLAQIGAAIGRRHDVLVLFGMLIITSGFLIKAAIVPFHFWLPDAHAVSPTPVCVMFSGLMVELGLFGILRVNSILFASALAPHAARLRLIYATFGAVTALFGGIMCFAEHHLKRLLAFSTISHAGLMLLALSMPAPLGVAAMLIYIFAHAFVKSGLFFTAGIILHRLRAISETLLFAKGRVIPWTGALWMLGGAGLAGTAPFATVLGESFSSHAAAAVHYGWTEYVFILAGALTGATIFRSGMRIFYGLGDAGPTDLPAKLGELPETSKTLKAVPFYLFAPALVCIVLAIALFFVPHIAHIAFVAAARATNQSAYINWTLFHSLQPGAILPSTGSLGASLFRGLAALLLALLLASAAVFHRKIPRHFRLASAMEGQMRGLRKLQSGHSGDYVAWLTVGLAIMGLALFSLR